MPKDFIQSHSQRAQQKGTPFGVVEDFDSFVREASMLPDGRPVRMSINNPIEQHFMNVADKHGVLDEILDPFSDYDDEY